MRFTDAKKYLVSEASVYLLLKSLDLMTSPAFIVIKAADEFRDQTTAINQLWQTDFTYLKVKGVGSIFMVKRSAFINSNAAKTIRSRVTCERLARKDPLSFQRDTASQLV